MRDSSGDLRRWQPPPLLAFSGLRGHVVLLARALRAAGSRVGLGAVGLGLGLPCGGRVYRVTAPRGRRWPQMAAKRSGLRGPIHRIHQFFQVLERLSQRAQSIFCFFDSGQVVAEGDADLVRLLFELGPGHNMVEKPLADLGARHVVGTKHTAAPTLVERHQAAAKGALGHADFPSVLGERHPFVDLQRPTLAIQAAVSPSATQALAAPAAVAYHAR